MERILFALAIFSTLSLIIMLAASLFGSDIETDLEIETNSNSSFGFFTIKNLFVYLSIFGWSGLYFNSIDFTIGTTLLFSNVFAILITIAIAALFYVTSKFQVDYSYDLEETIGKIGIVYQRIPKHGIGKVTVNYGGANRECPAYTRTGETECPTGSRVKVLSVNDNFLVVEPII